jgi:hypothetical protein
MNQAIWRLGLFRVDQVNVGRFAQGLFSCFETQAVIFAEQVGDGKKESVR